MQASHNVCVARDRRPKVLRREHTLGLRFCFDCDPRREQILDRIELSR